MLATMVGLLLLSLWWMKCYTHHGKSLQVHDYDRMKVEDAIKKAKTRNLQIVVNDSIFIVDEEPGIVLEQAPRAFSRVKKNRKIYLTVTKTNPDLVTLPDLAGTYDYSQYAKKLNVLGIKLRIRERVFNNKYEENTILNLYYKDEKISEEALKRGVKIPMGNVVEVVVTEQTSGRVALPNLVCRTYSAAEFLVTGNNLLLGKVSLDNTVTDKVNAYVYKQEPAYEPGSTIRMGQIMNIFLTQNRPAKCAIDDTEFIIEEPEGDNL